MQTLITILRVGPSRPSDIKYLTVNSRCLFAFLVFNIFLSGCVLMADEVGSDLRSMISGFARDGNPHTFLLNIGKGKQFSEVEACAVIEAAYQAQTNHESRGRLLYLSGELLDATGEATPTRDFVLGSLLKIYNANNSGPLEKRRALYLAAPYLSEERLLYLANDASQGIPADDVFAPLNAAASVKDSVVLEAVEKYSEEWIRSRGAVMEALFSRGTPKCIQLGLSQVDAAIKDDECVPWRLLYGSRRTIDVMVTTVAQAFALPLLKGQPVGANMLYIYDRASTQKYEEYLSDTKGSFASLAQTAAEGQDSATIALTNLRNNKTGGGITGLENCCLRYCGYSKRLNPQEWGGRAGSRGIVLAWLSRNVESLRVDSQSRLWVGNTEPFPVEIISYRRDCVGERGLRVSPSQ